jgi:hypothetical protein
MQYGAIFNFPKYIIDLSVDLQEQGNLARTTVPSAATLAEIPYPDICTISYESFIGWVEPLLHSTWTIF